MITQQFQKFKIDWNILTQITNLPLSKLNIQWYNCTDRTVQNSIINTYPDFFNTNPSSYSKSVQLLVEHFEQSNYGPSWSPVITVDGSGRISLRNCCFLKKVAFQTISTPLPRARPAWAHRLCRSCSSHAFQFPKPGK